MNGKNIVLVSGYVGTEPELKSTQSGKKVVRGTLGVPQGYGENKKTVWVKYEAWEKQAEFMSRWGRKGAALTIIGRLDVKEWTAPEDEKKHSDMVVIAENIEFALTAKSDQVKPGTAAQATQAPTYEAKPAEQATFTDLSEDDDLPF